MMDLVVDLGCVFKVSSSGYSYSSKNPVIAIPASYPADGLAIALIPRHVDTYVGKLEGMFLTYDDELTDEELEEELDLLDELDRLDLLERLDWLEWLNTLLDWLERLDSDDCDDIDCGDMQLYPSSF